MTPTTLYPIIGLLVDYDGWSAGGSTGTPGSRVGSPWASRGRPPTGLSVGYEISPKVGVALAVGLRYTDTSFEPLEPWIETLAPTGALTVFLPGRVAVNWSRNRYGTGVQQFSIDVAFPLSGGNPPESRL